MASPQRPSYPKRLKQPRLSRRKALPQTKASQQQPENPPQQAEDFRSLALVLKEMAGVLRDIAELMKTSTAAVSKLADELAANTEATELVAEQVRLNTQKMLERDPHARPAGVVIPYLHPVPLVDLSSPIA